jgi:hypothetical protein
MARIRTIKPAFWSDAKIAELSYGCMAFFIGLWNFCDDEGKCENDPRQLSLRMPVFRSKDILSWLRTLSELGLIQFSECSQWVLVTNWEHQRIDRPRPVIVKKESIQWLVKTNSTNDRESSSSVRRKDRIGKDRIGIGKDRILPPGVQAPAVAAVEKAAPKVSSAESWEAYQDAYQHRYGVVPIRNATVNAQMAQVVKRLGETEAPEVAAFYVSHNDAFYVRQVHPVGMLLRDAEKLRTEWATGRRTTAAGARAIDQKQNAYNAVQEVLERIESGKSDAKS